MNTQPASATPDALEPVTAVSAQQLAEEVRVLDASHSDYRALVRRRAIEGFEQDYLTIEDLVCLLNKLGLEPVDTQEVTSFRLTFTTTIHLVPVPRSAADSAFSDRYHEQLDTITQGAREAVESITNDLHLIRDEPSVVRVNYQRIRTQHVIVHPEDNRHPTHQHQDQDQHDGGPEAAAP